MAATPAEMTDVSRPGRATHRGTVARSPPGPTTLPVWSLSHLQTRTLAVLQTLAVLRILAVHIADLLPLRSLSPHTAPTAHWATFRLH
eukprot:547461-Hanusia_phi.AAC.1